LSRHDPVPADLPGLIADADGPVFVEPWEAQAFAMAVALHQAGCFTWPEWAETLSRALHRPGVEATSYYHHWLSALEELVAAKGILSGKALLDRKEAWRAAADATPHGMAITLEG
jgi:nitrile hydratase accessory protein